MQTTSLPEEDARRLMELMATLGRRNSLRDPLAMVLEEAGLSSAQVHAILWLGTDAPLTMGALAQRLGVSDKTITGVVDRLEKGGYARRDRALDDRRVVQVVLTRKGQQFAERLNRDIAHKMALFLSLLDVQDRKDLFRILEHLVARLQPVADPVSPHPAR